MPRNVEDIVPSNRRSIRDIPLPERRKGERRVATRREEDKEEKKATQEVEVRKATPAEEREIVREVETGEIALPRMNRLERPTRSPRSGGRSKKSTWIGIAVAILVLAFALFSFFRSATLAYTPKTLPLAFNNESFNAYKTGSDGVLLFSVVKLSDTASKTVNASGETQVSRKATGTIIVYNNTSSAQKLIANTRFESADGHIYRIGNAISIPAKSSAGPGSLEASVTADQPGAEYNIGLTDFTVPGLKGDPRFQTVYGRSKTAMDGGLVGTEKAVSDADLAAAKSDLSNQLKDKLAKAAEAQVPTDFVMFPSLAETTYSDLPQSSSTQSTVNVNMKGDFYGVIFKKADLDAYIAAHKLTLTQGQSITIDGLDALTLSFAGTPPADLLSASQITFTINGNATAVMVTDEDALKQSLVGVSKSDLPAVLQKFPSIQSADAVIRPFWKTSFPSDAKQITIRSNGHK